MINTSRSIHAVNYKCQDDGSKHQQFLEEIAHMLCQHEALHDTLPDTLSYRQPFPLGGNTSSASRVTPRLWGAAGEAGTEAGSVLWADSGVGSEMQGDIPGWPAGECRPRDLVVTHVASPRACSTSGEPALQPTRRPCPPISGYVASQFYRAAKDWQWRLAVSHKDVWKMLVLRS